MKDLVDNESDLNFNVRKLQGTITNYFGNRIQLVKEKKKKIKRNMKPTRNIPSKNQFC